MRKEKLLKVLRAPHLSEKAASTAGQYVFEVAKCANKQTIKAAVEELFKVDVKSVNVVRIKGTKTSKMGRTSGQHSSWKKAYVVLQDGQQLNLA